MHVFAIILRASSFIYIVGFSHGGVRDSLTHCMHLKGKTNLTIFLLHVEVCCLCVFLLCLILFDSDGWYSSCSDTRSLFTRQTIYKRRMMKIFVDYLYKFMKVVFGDINIYGIKKYHLEILELYLIKCRENGINLNSKKYSFAST